MTFTQLKVLPNSLEEVCVVELRPLTVVVLVAASERTKGMPWVL